MGKHLTVEDTELVISQKDTVIHYWNHICYFHGETVIIIIIIVVVVVVYRDSQVLTNISVVSSH